MFIFQVKISTNDWLVFETAFYTGVDKKEWLNCSTRKLMY